MAPKPAKAALLSTLSRPPWPVSSPYPYLASRAFSPFLSLSLSLSLSLTTNQDLLLPLGPVHRGRGRGDPNADGAAAVGHHLCPGGGRLRIRQCVRHVPEEVGVEPQGLEQLEHLDKNNDERLVFFALILEWLKQRRVSLSLSPSPPSCTSCR